MTRKEAYKRRISRSKDNFKSIQAKAMIRAKVKTLKEAEIYLRDKQNINCSDIFIQDCFYRMQWV